MPRDEIFNRIREVDGLLCMLTDQIDKDLIEQGQHLRVISQMAAGTDNIDLAAATQRGIPVGHTPDVLTETTADTAFALTAAVARRIVEGQQLLRDGRVGEWSPEFLIGGDLAYTTMGIVGLGRIGQAVARRARAFEMEILYCGPRERPEAKALGAKRVSLEALAARADHVVLTAPLGPDTYHLLNGDVLGRMRPGATLINVARGALVDHDALTRLARVGAVNAGLDVTEPEPLPTDHELLHLPNVIVTPHLASASARTRREMARLAVANLRSGLEDTQLPAVANPDYVNFRRG